MYLTNNYHSGDKFTCLWGWQRYWENQQEVWVNTTRIAKISVNPKNGSNHKYFAGERQVQENPELTKRRSYMPMQNTTGRCKRIIQLNKCM